MTGVALEWGVPGLFELLNFLYFGAMTIAVVMLLVALLRGSRRRPRVSSALEILEERYARGEIERDEFLERRDVLQRTAPR